MIKKESIKERKAEAKRISEMIREKDRERQNWKRIIYTNNPELKSQVSVPDHLKYLFS